MKRIAGLAVVAVAVGVVIGWAARVIVAPVETESPAEPTVVTITHGEVSSTFTFGLTVRWRMSPVGPNAAEGVLTSLPDEALVAEEGAVLYTVDLRPVSLAVGEVPMFRDIEPGVRGDDITAVQGMLAALGYRVGAEGVADAATIQAVRAWQRELGMNADGVVRVGDVIIVPSAPVRVAANSEFGLGDRLAGGESVLERFADSPETIMVLTEAQASLVPPGVRVRVSGPGGVTWTGEAGAARVREDGAEIEVPVLAEDGGPICADECGEVAESSDGALMAQVFRVEPTEGLTVPATAITTDPGGQASVTIEDGDRIDVAVVASADGMAIVEGDGISEGTRVVVVPP